MSSAESIPIWEDSGAEGRNRHQTQDKNDYKLYALNIHDTYMSIKQLKNKHISKNSSIDPPSLTVSLSTYNKFLKINSTPNDHMSSLYSLLSPL